MLARSKKKRSSNPKCYKHTKDTASEALKNRGLDFLSVVRIDPDNDSLVVLDKLYGEYSTIIKNLSPSMSFPLHKDRKRQDKLEAAKKAQVNKKYGTLTILEVFYGPHEGYKNKGFYIRYVCDCGHRGVSTFTHLTRYRKHFSCSSCSLSDHGFRKKIEGVLQKRTPTYVYWQTKKKKLPDRYSSFAVFLKEVGEKPHKKAKLEQVGDRFLWVQTHIEEEEEVNLIATAVRQSFRRSKLYKTALRLSMVETNEGTRYRCALCKNLFRLKDVQVDHVDPIAKIDGTPLRKEEIIDRVWTNKIQVLDRKCHSKKSALENQIRRTNKHKSRLHSPPK